jgi:HSP20 family protein
MAKSVNRYFHLLTQHRTLNTASRLWNPAADVYRASNGWIVKVDLAGVAESDLEIVVEDATIRISGVRRDTFCEAEDVICQQLEITYSRFEKILSFPASIAGAKLIRDYRDGLLILYLTNNPR